MVPEWASALAAKAKVAGLLGAAIAAGGVGGTVALTHVSPASTQVVTTSASASADPETQSAQDPETPQAQDPQTAPTVTPPTCPAGVKNHGAYVSSVAKSAAHGKGANHGALVSAAAKTDCGKNTSAGADSSSSGSDSKDSPDTESGDSGSGDSGSGATHSQAPNHTPPAQSHAKTHSHQH